MELTICSGKASVLSVSVFNFFEKRISRVRTYVQMVGSAHLDFCGHLHVEFMIASNANVLCIAECRVNFCAAVQLSLFFWVPMACMCARVNMKSLMR